VLALPVAAFGLAVAFLCITIVTGYLLGLAAGLPNVAPATFLDRLLNAFELEDVAALPFSVLLPALTTASICCMEGLAPKTAVTDVARCLPRGFVRCVVTLALIQMLVALVFFT
jgi:ABC-type transporter Mla maintaining outer membrane lipid asymmetry permease subunit MlaE